MAARKSDSQLRSRQRAKAMAVALGLVMAITLGLLSLVNSSSELRAEGEIGHVTRHLRELLLNHSARENAAAMEAQGQHPNRPAAMEAQGRRTRKVKPQGVAMEAQTQHTASRVVGVTVTVPPTDTPSPSSHSHPSVVMEALSKAGNGKATMAARDNWKPVSETVADAEAKAEEAEEIAQEAMSAANRAEERAEAAEAAAEMSIIAQVGNMVAGEQMPIFGEIEDSDSEDSKDSKDSKDSEEKEITVAKTFKNDRSW